MKKLEHLLYHNEFSRQVFTPPTMISYLSVRRLSRHLVLAKLFPLERKRGSSKCENSRCQFKINWCKVSSLYLVAVPNYGTWTKTTPQKMWFYWPNLYKIEVVITSLIEMLEFSNFGNMNASTI